MNNRKTITLAGLLVLTILLAGFLYVNIPAFNTSEAKQMELTPSEIPGGSLKPIIIFGDELDYPPYSFVDDQGIPSGFSIDLAKSIADVMGYDAVIKQKNWDLVLQSLDSGEIDVISGMFYTAERAEKYDFTMRYTVARGDVFSEKHKIISDIKELDGKTVVVPSGDIVHEYLKTLNLDITLIAVPTASDALQMVASGKYDYAAVLKIPGIYITENNKLTNLYANGLQIAPEDYCMAVKKGNEAMLATLNEGLQILKKTGRYQELNDKWLGVYDKKTLTQHLGQYIWLGVIILFFIALLLLWILTLRIRVAKKTKDLVAANKRLQDRQQELQFSNKSLSVLNAIALEQAAIKRDEDLRALINTQLIRLTGCTLVSFNEYDKIRNIMITKKIDADFHIIKMISKFSSVTLFHNETTITKLMFEDLMKSRLIKKNRLSDILGRPGVDRISNSLQRLLGLDKFILISYVIDGELLGTSMLALVGSKEQPDDESLNFFALISSISIKRCKAEEDLIEAIQFNREIIQTAQEGIIVYDREHRYQLWNKYMENLTKVSANQAIGSLPYEIFPALSGTNLYSNLDRGLNGEVFMGQDYQANVGDNPEKIWISHSYGPLRNSEGDIVGVISTIQDITERKSYEEHLKYISLHDQLTKLYNRSLFEEEMQIMQRGREYPITIISCDLDGLKIINDTMGHSTGDELLIKFSEIIQNSLREGDILARIGGDEFAAILPKTDFLAGEAIVKRIQRKVANYNSISQHLPLSISIGISTTRDADTTLEKVLKNADERMYHEKLIQKKSSRSQIIDSLMVALAEKDYLTEGHSQRLSFYAEKMSKTLGLPHDIMTNLNLLTQVHDLGKVGIPDQILQKKGKLTDEEWVIMRQHPEKGYRIAIASPDLSQIADLILKHHESWDGTGYQLGIKGEEIPIECRILAIIDSYDAMTNDRPYSRAKTSEAAIKEIKRCAGTQFDPKLVDLFVQIITEHRGEA